MVSHLTPSHRPIPQRRTLPAYLASEDLGLYQGLKTLRRARTLGFPVDGLTALEPKQRGAKHLG